MSLEFNRRSFLKYTAAAAVVVAGSSLLTGCGEAYTKTGTIGDKLTLMGEHTLLGSTKAPEVKDAASSSAGSSAGSSTGTSTTTKYDITCKLTHKCTSKRSLLLDKSCYELTVYNSNDKKNAVDYTTSNMTFTPNKYDLAEENGEQNYTLIINGVALTDGQYVDLKYWPRKVATTENSYTASYCTWQMQAKTVNGEMTLAKR